MFKLLPYFIILIIYNFRLHCLLLVPHFLNSYSSDLRLNPKIVEGEFQVLSQVAGEDSNKHPLEYINYYGKNGICKV